MSRRPRRPGPLTLALAALTAGAVAVAIVVVGAPSSSGSSAAERTVAVKQGVVQSTVSGSGNLEPANQLDLDFATSGEITRVYVKEGQHVSKGDLLATLDPSAAEVALAQAKADLQTAQDTLDSVSGDVASTGETRASTQLASYSGDGAATASAAVYTGGATARMAQATTTTPTPATTTPTPAATTPAATTTTPATTTPTQTTPTQTTPTQTTPARTTPQTTTTPETTATQQQTPSRSGGGGSGGGSATGGSGASGGGSGSTMTEEAAQAAVESAQLAVENAEKALAATRLRAPMAGTVAEVNGSAGEQVGSSSSSGGGSSSPSAQGGTSSSSSSSSSSLVVLTQLSRFRMQVSLTESDIGKVKVGQAATVTVNAASGAQFAAHVTKIGVLSSSSSSGTSGAVSYPVTLTLDQSDKALKAGMSASAEVVVAEQSGLVVPTAAISGNSVTVEKNGSRSTQRVTTGVAGDTSTIVLSGVQEGDTVVVRSTAPTGTAGTGSGADQVGAGLQRRFGGGAGGGGFGAAGGGGFGGGGFGGGGGAGPRQGP